MESFSMASRSSSPPLIFQECTVGPLHCVSLRFSREDVVIELVSPHRYFELDKLPGVRVDAGNLYPHEVLDVSLVSRLTETPDARITTGDLLGGLGDRLRVPGLRLLAEIDPRLSELGEDEVLPPLKCRNSII
jgi:hypothetical protein